MDHKSEEKVQKYTLLYMSLGMCFGVSIGLLYGMFLFPGNMALGICLGLPTGMCFGMAIGSAKDKRLSEKMMKIVRIETISETSDVMISAVDKNGNEKDYRTSEEKLKAEKFSVGNRVAEDEDGSLVSLEN